MSDLFFRPGTYDRSIWQSVFDHDEYGLADVVFGPADVILDIGAHIGSFSYTALHRGAGLVVAIEADVENCHFYRHNLHVVCGANHRAVLLNGAAWRSDVLAERLHYSGVGSNTGGGNVLGAEGLTVKAVPFDALVRLAASMSPVGRVRLAKLDCEGSEWPILLTSKCLHLIDAIVGEYHCLTDLGNWPAARVDTSNSYDLGTLEYLLNSNGFDYEIFPTAGSHIGLFRAWRGRERFAGSEPLEVFSETGVIPMPEPIPALIPKAIGFCLYGDKPLYCEGMIRNALLAPRVFPAWRVVVFHDHTVPPATLDALSRLKCVLIDCTGRRESGMFWRFGISRIAQRWINRDADSRLDVRDLSAVEEWEASGETWHVVRDSVHHTSPVLTGLLGGYQTGDLLERELADWHQFGGHFDDQSFIVERLWPAMQNSVWVHDFRGHPVPRPRTGSEFVGQIIDTEENPR